MTEDRDDRLDLTAAPRALAAFASTLVLMTVAVRDYALRMAGKTETLLDESIGFLRDVRPLVGPLREAVDAGLIHEVRRVLATTDSTMEQLAQIGARMEAPAVPVEAPAAKAVSARKPQPEDVALF